MPIKVVIFVHFADSVCVVYCILGCLFDRYGKISLMHFRFVQFDFV